MSGQQENKLTRTQYANYKGLSKSTVSKWSKNSRLVFTDDLRFVLVSESDKRIRETSSLNHFFPDRKAKEERDEINASIAQKEFTELTDEVNYQQLDLESDDAEILYRNARALREKAAALQAAAEHSKYISELVDREEVNKIVFDRARQFRDGLLACARRISPQVAATQDIKAVERILNDEFRSILDQFSKLPVVNSKQA